jgi:anti-sigma B factor antagonist
VNVTSEHPYLTIEVTGAPDAQTIALAGEADILGAPELEAAFAEACSGAPAPGRIVLDLRNLTFIDSSGLHALVTGHQLCCARGHDLKVIPGPANVQRLFELTGMNQILPFVEPEPILGSEPPPSDEPAPSV